MTTDQASSRIPVSLVLGSGLDLGYRRTRAALDRDPACADGGW